MFYHSILKPQVEAEWVPNTDIYADADGLVVKMELAGLPKDKVDVVYDRGVLTVSGRRCDPASGIGDGDRRFSQVEIEYGCFKRVITIDTPVDVRRVSARLQDGILFVRLPKAERARKKRIHIKL